MTEHTGRATVLFRILPLSVVLATGCSDQNKGTAADTTDTAASPIGSAATVTSTLDSLEGIFATLAGGRTRKRKVEGCDCGVDVNIKPVGNVHLINPANGPERPQYVARIYNTDRNQTTEYPRFKPGKDFVYYVEIYRRTDGRAGWRLLEMTHPPQPVVTAVDSGRLVGCSHDPNTTPDADFRGCNGANPLYTDSSQDRLKVQTSSLTANPIYSRLVSTSRAFLVRAGREDPTWISCTEGCCTLNAM
jgi:hypothetical protein